MTQPLLSRITRHIEMSGPLPLAEYMHWCLADKTDGYYQSASSIGRDGDFITAPEVSQMFGELIGVWMIEAWETLGSPSKFNLVELGPGNGTLMADLLRACKVKPEFLDAAEISLIETSDRLRKIQTEKLTNLGSVNWHSSIDDLPEGPILLVANEFLDALPFRQYVKSASKWLERCVGLGEDGNLTWVLGSVEIGSASLPAGHDDEPDGAVFELSTIRESFVSRICDLLKARSGAALLIDYGYTEPGFGDTFQAISKHNYSDPLSEPGLHDLTSHVDFSPFAEIARQAGCTPMDIMSQGDFLLSLGLLERAGTLGRNKNTDEQERIRTEAERLALPEQMGDLFKVFVVSSTSDLWPFS